MGLNNREIAIALWLCVGLIWAFKQEKIRQSLFVVARAFLAWRMLVLWALMALYVAGEVNVLALVSLWDPSHLKDTLLWSITVGLVLFMQFVQTGMDSFKQGARQLFNWTLIFDFLANLYTFPLVAEMVLFPVLVFLGLMSAVSQTKEQFKPVERVINNLMMLFGCVVVIYIAYSLYSNWSSFAQVQTAKDFLVPLALSLLFLPYIYLGMLFLTYERFLARCRFYVPDEILRRRFKRRIVIHCNFSATTLENCEKRLRANQLCSESDIRAFFGRPAPEETRPPDGYRSLKWGQPPLEGMRLFSSTKSDTMLALYKPDNYSPFLGLPISEELYGFTDGKLYEGMTWIDGPERFQEARVRISALHGPPSFANEDRQLWKWKWPDSAIEIHIWYESKFDRGSILFINNAI